MGANRELLRPQQEEGLGGEVSFGSKFVIMFCAEYKRGGRILHVRERPTEREHNPLFGRKRTVGEGYPC